MTRPLAPNSMTIEAGDPTKIRELDLTARDRLRGYSLGLEGMEIPLDCDMLNLSLLTGYFAGCDARRGITR